MRIQQTEYTYDKVFTFQHFVAVLPKCLKGVSWKPSVQKYYIGALVKMFVDFVSMKNRELPKLISDYDITIFERGKARIITPIHIKDRVIQKVLCDYALVPILSKKLIYDNGASLKGKGVQFSRNRMFRHLLNAVKEYGTNFYVFSFDFKDFFKSIPHKTCRRILEKYVYDKELVNMTMNVIKSHYRTRIMKIKDKKKRLKMLRELDNDEMKGICLGSQVSQIMALIIANDIDHYTKDVMKCKCSIRYMDDGNVFLRTKEECKALYNDMKKITDKLGLEFNERKTHIIKIRKGFTFLKVRYFVTDTKKIVRVMAKKGTVRMRRKLHKFKPKVENDELTLGNVYDSMQAWLTHSEIANSYRTVKRMLKLYNELFDGYKLTRKWEYKCGGKNSNELLQTDKWSEYRWSGIA